MSSHNELIEKLTEKLKSWDYQIDRLEHRLADLGEEGRQKANDALASLKEQRKQLASRLEAGRNNANEMVDDLKDGMDKAMDDLKSSLKKIREQLGLKDDD